MTSRDFCYWLQGFFELRAKPPGLETGLTPEQTQCIRAHLEMAFRHEIDNFAGDAKHQEVLNKIHNNQAIGGPLMRC